MWRRTKDMWTGDILEDLHVDGKPQAVDLTATIPGGPRDIITTFWFDPGTLPDGPYRSDRRPWRKTVRRSLGRTHRAPWCGLPA